MRICTVTKIILTMSQQNNVFLNINLIHALLTISRPAGFSISKTNQPEKLLKNQWKVICVACWAIFSLYQVIFVGYNPVDFGELTALVNSLVTLGLIFTILNITFKYHNHIKIYDALKTLHDCDLMVNFKVFWIF